MKSIAALSGVACPLLGTKFMNKALKPLTRAVRRFLDVNATIGSASVFGIDQALAELPAAHKEYYLVDACNELIRQVERHGSLSVYDVPNLELGMVGIGAALPRPRKPHPSYSFTRPANRAHPTLRYGLERNAKGKEVYVVRREEYSPNFVDAKIPF